MEKCTHQIFVNKPPLPPADRQDSALKLLWFYAFNISPVFEHKDSVRDMPVLAECAKRGIRGTKSGGETSALVEQVCSTP